MGGKGIPFTGLLPNGDEYFFGVGDLGGAFFGTTVTTLTDTFVNGFGESGFFSFGYLNGSLINGNETELYFNQGALLVEMKNNQLFMIENGATTTKYFEVNVVDEELGFFGSIAAQQSITETSADVAITELQNILINYGLALDNR